MQRVGPAAAALAIVACDERLGLAGIACNDAQAVVEDANDLRSAKIAKIAQIAQIVHIGNVLRLGRRSEPDESAGDAAGQLDEQRAGVE